MADANTTENSAPIIPFNLVLKKLNLNDKHILEAFVVGSRLWGTCGPDSDYDLILVVDDKTPALTASSQKGFANVHAGNIDAMLISSHLYRERINACSMLELATLWLPSNYVLRRATNREHWSLNPASLQQYITDTVERDWKMAQKYFEKGMVERGKKTLIHSFRIVHFALQLLQSQPPHISNYQAALEYFEEMKYNYDKSWATYESQYRPVINQLLAQIAAAVSTVNR